MPPKRYVILYHISRKALSLVGIRERTGIRAPHTSFIRPDRFLETASAISR